MAVRAELAGELQPRETLRQTMNRAHGVKETLTADSSRVVSRAKRGQGARAAVGDECGLGEIQNATAYGV